MRAIIKAVDIAADRVAIRPLAGAGAAIEWATDREQIESVEVAALRRTCDTLVSEVREKDAEIEQLRGEVTRAFHDGEAQGRRLGLMEADERRRDYLSQLELGVRQAILHFGAQLSSLDRLAAAISRHILAKILGDADSRIELLAAAVRHQLDQLEAQSVICILVSEAEFPANEELQQLLAAIGARGVELHATNELKSGECRIKLRLGAIDVGIEQQCARALRAAIDGQQQVVGTGSRHGAGTV